MSETNLHTSRLLIKPLSANQLDLYLQGENAYEIQENLVVNHRTVSPTVAAMVREKTLPLIRLAKNDSYLFITFWIVVDKTINTIVAELGFKGAPDASGCIEIGYGTIPGFTGNGYLTEALGVMIHWAETYPGLRKILAETQKNNLASIRVLQKNRFVQIEQRGDMIWWEYRLPDLLFTPDS